MRAASTRRHRTAGFLAVSLLLAQLAWAGHVQLHAADVSDNCRVCAHLDRLDAATPVQAGLVQTLTADQHQPAILAESFFVRSVERPRVRAPPFC